MAVCSQPLTEQTYFYGYDDELIFGQIFLTVTHLKGFAAALSFIGMSGDHVDTRLPSVFILLQKVKQPWFFKGARGFSTILDPGEACWEQDFSKDKYVRKAVVQGHFYL